MAGRSHRAAPRHEVTAAAIRLLDLDSYEPEEMYGLICKAEQNSERIELPLDRIDVLAEGPNRQLLEDYRYWMRSWG